MREQCADRRDREAEHRTTLWRNMAEKNKKPRSTTTSNKYYSSSFTLLSKPSYIWYVASYESLTLSRVPYMYVTPKMVRTRGRIFHADFLDDGEGTNAERYNSLRKDLDYHTRIIDLCIAGIFVACALLVSEKLALETRCGGVCYVSILGVSHYILKKKRYHRQYRQQAVVVSSQRRQQTESTPRFSGTHLLRLRVPHPPHNSLHTTIAPPTHRRPTRKWSSG